MRLTPAREPEGPFVQALPAVAQRLLEGLVGPATKPSSDIEISSFSAGIVNPPSFLFGVSRVDGIPPENSSRRSSNLELDDTYLQKLV